MGNKEMGEYRVTIHELVPIASRQFGAINDGEASNSISAHTCFSTLRIKPILTFGEA